MKSGKEVVEQWKKDGGIVVHLTMYGLNLTDVLDQLYNELNSRKILVVIGSEKVDPWYYSNSDYNIGIGNQPHSEVAAIAIFLDRIYKGEELKLEFSDAKLLIIPQKSGKKVISIGK